MGVRATRCAMVGLALVAGLVGASVGAAGPTTEVAASTTPSGATAATTHGGVAATTPGDVRWAVIGTAMSGRRLRIGLERAEPCVRFQPEVLRADADHIELHVLRIRRFQGSACDTAKRNAARVAAAPPVLAVVLHVTIQGQQIGGPGMAQPNEFVARWWPSWTSPARGVLTMPRLTGLRVRPAIALLKASGLARGRIRTTGTEAAVFKQRPAPGARIGRRGAHLWTGTPPDQGTAPFNPGWPDCEYVSRARGCPV